MTGSRPLGSPVPLRARSTSPLSQRASRWCLGTVAAALAFASPAFAQVEGFEKAVRSWNRGDRAAAISGFEEVLAAGPDAEEAYAMWQAVDHQAWLDMLVAGGPAERFARRIMDLSTERREELSDDLDTIRGLLGELNEAGPLDRIRVISRLRADHGEFAVPAMLGALADDGNAERRVSFMVALADLGPAAVRPLIASLDASSDVLRRNAALTLGNLRDSRATGALAHLAQNDGSAAVREAALASLDKLGGTGGRSSAEWLIEQGNAFLDGSVTALVPGLRNEVVWNFAGGRLNAQRVDPAVFAEEMGKQTFTRALAADPGNLDALGGLARSAAKQLVEIDELRARGADDESLTALEQSSLLALAVAGPEAADRGLNQSLSRDDLAGSIGLLRVLGESAVGMQPALRSALATTHPQVRSEAALAAAHAGLRGGQEIAPGVIEMLGTAAGREIVQVALVIDPNRSRGAAIASALRSRNIAAQVADTGARGLQVLFQMPGVDLIVLSDRLPDLTVDQVLVEIENTSTSKGTPVWMLGEDADRTAELYGERTAGAGTGADDLPVLDELMAGQVNRDREQADRLSELSAKALSRLAGAGVEISGAADGLVGSLGGRPDRVVIPALEALGRGAAPRHLSTMLNVVGDGARSDEARAAAAGALATAFRRNNVTGSEATLAPLTALLSDGEASFELRSAVGRAIGALGLEGEARVGLMSLLSGTPSE